MRILVLGINYWPEETGIAVFNTGRCERLAARGHEVTMCTAMPYYPWWRIPVPYKSRLFSRERRNGVNVLRSWLYVPRQPNSVRRVIHEASFVALSCLRALGAAKPELLMVVSPPLGLSVTAGLLSRLRRAPYVFHVADLQPDAALDLGMVRPGRLSKALYALEKMAYRRAALVTTLTEAMRSRIVSKGITPDKVALFPDWADPAPFRVPLVGGGERFRRVFGLEDRFLVVHAGNMGVKQGLGVVLEAAQRTRDRPDVTYLLVGDGAMREVLEARARALGLLNVRFLPLQPRHVFLDLLAAADACLITQQRAVADIVFPSKVLTLLAAGRPIIASLNASSEVARVVAEAGAGMIVAPEDPAALAEAVVELKRDAAARRSMGERGREYAGEHWERDRTLSAMEERLVAVAGRRR